MEPQPKIIKAGLLKMEGISSNQIVQHYDILYKGYVNKTNEINKKLILAERDKANQTYSELRELKVELSFALNGVKLHEAYFDNLAGAGTVIDEGLKAELTKVYGSYENWEEDFKASGMAARGWVIAAYEPADGRIYNYIADDHNTYGIWWAIPLLILDVYEHAYFIDYGASRVSYINAFMHNIDWNVINQRFKDIQACRFISKALEADN